MIDNHPISYEGITPTPDWAFQQYQRIRCWLPDGLPTDQRPDPQLLDNLLPLANQFQVFVFDAFGVLNAGPRAFPVAIQRFRELQQMGKQVQILSNAATAPHAKLVEKYQRLGFDITPEQLISSRWLLERSLSDRGREGLWGVIAPENSEPETLPLNWQPVRPSVTEQLKRKLDSYDGLIMLSSEDWNEEMQTALEATLTKRPRPLEIANPDLVAPRGDCLTLEPGFFAHRAREASGVLPQFYGKPYAPAFQAVLERFAGVPPERYSWWATPFIRISSAGRTPA